ncbi:MAG: AAA family ATPase, partial [Bacilli bacterium]
MDTQKLFVVGTDTNIGKTMITAGLASIYKENRKVVVYKPVQSGSENGQTDTMYIESNSGVKAV